MYTVRIGNFIKIINSIKRIGTNLLNLLNQAFQELCPVIGKCELGLKHMKSIGGKGTKRELKL